MGAKQKQDTGVDTAVDAGADTGADTNENPRGNAKANARGNAQENIKWDSRRCLSPLLERGRKRYRKKLARCRKRFTPEAVHALRVETRRLLALCDVLRELRELRGLESGLRVRKLRRLLKKRLDAFDALRDVQVQIELLRRWNGKTAPEDAMDPECKTGALEGSGGAPAALVADLLRERETRLVRRLRRKVQALRPGPVVRKLRALERMQPESTSEDLAAVLQESGRRVEEAFVAIQVEKPESFHRARVALKRYRYQRELLDLPGATQKRGLPAERLQDELGAIQDWYAFIQGLHRGLRKGRYPHHASLFLLQEASERLRGLCSRFAIREGKTSFHEKPGPADGSL